MQDYVNSFFGLRSYLTENKVTLAENRHGKTSKKYMSSCETSVISVGF